MASAAIDIHTQSPLRDKKAMIWIGKNGEHENYTFIQLKALSDKFALVLKSLGVVKGDRVVVYLDRVPEQYIAILGSLKIGAIVSTLSTKLGPYPVKNRMKNCDAKILITNPLMRRKFGDFVYELFELQHILIVNKNGRDPWPNHTTDLDYYEEMNKTFESLKDNLVTQTDYSTISYVPNISGSPVGALHTHKSVIQHYKTGKYVLDLHDKDIYWCTVDLGYTTGISSGMFAPWTNGTTQVVYEDNFKASNWYEQLQENRVSVWCTSSTALRLLKRAGNDLPKKYDLSSIRHVVTIGEQTDFDTLMWAKDVLGLIIRNTWSQTETGTVLIYHPILDYDPYSIGVPTPGTEIAILDNSLQPIKTGEGGLLSIRNFCPSLPANYWNDETTYRSKFEGEWFITGELAKRDHNGRIIKLPGPKTFLNTAGGSLINGSEIEACIEQHPAVLKAQASSSQHILAGNVLAITVQTTTDQKPTKELQHQIMRFARTNLGTLLAPRQLQFSQLLPES